MGPSHTRQGCNVEAAVTWALSPEGDLGPKATEALQDVLTQFKAGVAPRSELNP